MVSIAAVNPAAAPLRTGVQLLAAYDVHVDALMVAKGVRFERRRAARQFLQQHPNPAVWMRRPTAARLADLHRLKAWPFVSWCFIQRHLVPDVELLLAKPSGCGLPVEWAEHEPDNVAAVAEAAAVLGWSSNWQRQVGLLAASTICLHVGKRVRQLTEDDFACVLGQLDGSAALSASARHHARTRLFALQQACYQLGSVSTPPRQSGPVAVGPLVHAAGVRQPLIRTEVVRYVQTITTTLRPYTVAGRTKALRVFFDYLANHHPEVTRLEQIERTRHIEPYLAWARTRPWRGKNRQRRTIGVVAFHQDVVDLRCFFEDIAGWGWPSAPPRRLLFYADIPRTPDAPPRALTPDVDRALMTAVANLDDPLVRTGLLLLRATGMRLGELLDLELDCLLDFAGHGTWLRVPVGKLNCERMVPLDPDTVQVIDAWIAQRGRQRALPHPRDGRLTEFLFLEHGRRPTSFRLRKGLLDAVAAAELRGRDGKLLHITPHQLRHTFGTSLINGGIGLPALMALMGHVTPEMTLRYAKLATPTIRSAYQAAIDKVRAGQLLPLTAVNAAPPVPDKVAWLHAEMLKTRLAHGFCARPKAAGPCPYANICEQCDFFVPDPAATATISAQLDDTRALQADAQARGWDDEAARHRRVAASLDQHLQRLRRHHSTDLPS
ncbi:MAG: tyrosine-type recombinase/integrase [Mycobacterium sp.]|uniref:tyrosine-type recombinase/integrase n=1 Tax=Mycobacterium sp. TaxID=1785 RepID=UPI0026198C1F|nr:tyrosine-type recombinase/integrase [Mycobacterium sp.]MDI3315936.1 tyrosine-type recombinase/integrase [Mycobacterium sp.]